LRPRERVQPRPRRVDHHRSFGAISAQPRQDAQTRASTADDRELAPLARRRHGENARPVPSNPTKPPPSRSFAVARARPRVHTTSARAARRSAIPRAIFVARSAPRVRTARRALPRRVAFFERFIERFSIEKVNEAWMCDTPDATTHNDARDDA
tara:strand:+ start:4360 stop:4821 length:462 start_codon:yes stop_codon:yes gene_type:complete